MALKTRQENIEYADDLLNKVIEKNGPVKLMDFISALKDKTHLGVRHITAVSYWEAIKSNYNHDGFRIISRKSGIKP